MGVPPVIIHTNGIFPYKPTILDVPIYGPPISGIIYWIALLLLDSLPLFRVFRAMKTASRSSMIYRAISMANS